ncbi:MAG: DUF2971 domain-containing protein [Rubrivivax sp.]|nr:MAG: DUF2971 domain-containing protein [Rubrivivax sp.]
MANGDSTPAVLYHYCSTETFLAIAQSRTVRLSSVRLSNDSFEGRLVHQLLLDIAKTENVRQIDIERLDNTLDVLGDIVDGLALCLSEEPDLLSQWRGYAADGAGVCIGFRTDKLQLVGANPEQGELPSFTIERVEYERSAQLERLKPVLENLKSVLQQPDLNPPGLLGLPDDAFGSNRPIEEIVAEQQEKRIKAIRKFGLRLLGEIMGELFTLKTRAFREEREWRALSIRVGVEQGVQFRAAPNRVVPFRAFNIGSVENVIAEVVLGPKHISPERLIEQMLSSFGFHDVPVRRSEATYR